MNPKQLFFLPLITLLIMISNISIVSASYTGLVLETDIMFYLPSTGAYIYWDQPLLVDSFEINTSQVYFYHASFDGINFHDFGISVNGANVSIDEITAQYVKLTLYAPTGTISTLDFYALAMPLTVRVQYGTTEEVIQDNNYFHDITSFNNANTPAALYTDHLKVKVEHHSPVTVYIYFVRYSGQVQAASVEDTNNRNNVGPSGVLVKPTQPQPSFTVPKNISDVIGLFIIIFSIASVVMYKEFNKRIPDLWNERVSKLRKRKIKWKKYKKPWE